MSKIDLVSFWYSNSSIGMAPYVNTTADGGHIDYEGVSSKVDLDTRIQSIMSALPDFFSSYTIKLTDVNLGGILVSKAECVLKVSSSENPDYTQVLTDINTNLTNLNEKFVHNNNSISKVLSNTMYYEGVVGKDYGLSKVIDYNSNKILTSLNRLNDKLQQSVIPNANITDVISALNTTIDSKQDTTIVNNEVTPLAEINIDVPFEVKNLKKSDVEL